MSSNTETTYNGYTNSKTWNVALQLNHDFDAWCVICKAVEAHRQAGKKFEASSLKAFISTPSALGHKKVGVFIGQGGKDIQVFTEKWVEGWINWQELADNYNEEFGL